MEYLTSTLFSGELLIEKANNGVDVYVMVWSEKSSGDIVGEQGIMGTHDMETFNYFKVEIKRLLNSLISHVIGTLNVKTLVVKIA